MNTEKTEHTPVPWKRVGSYIEQSGKRIVAKAVVLDRTNGAKQEEEHRTVEANADFIVRACNSFYELVGLCEEAAETIIYETSDPDHDTVIRLLSAISRARGGE